MSEPDTHGEPAARRAAAPSCGELGQWLVDRVARAVGLEPGAVNVREPLVSYGLSSRDAVVIAGELEEWLGVEVSPTLAYEYPTIDEMALYLSDAGDGDDGATAPEHTRPAGHVAAGLRASTGDYPPDSVAIIGLACRFPGANDARSFWNLVESGGDAITEVPVERWQVDTHYDADVDAPGKMYTRWGGFLPGVDRFDRSFFGISPRETVCMDPQQRIVLEVAWEALENAGQVVSEMRGSHTGVFVGLSTHDYLELQATTGDLTTVTPYSGTGVASSVAAGRLSFALGVTGPSLAVDTACSSSLVALHLAAQSLRLHESDLALAAGVNLVLSPGLTIYFCRLRALAADGRCKAFDSRADGYVRSDGCGVVVLKRLSDALEAGDRILAVVRSSAVNHDGRTSGFTVPSQPAQQAVIREALAAANLGPKDLDYVEAHGSGTLLGDAVELRSLGAVFADDTNRESPLMIGSVKTNVGHTEAAAGIAGVIKTVLALQHGTVPPHLHLKEPAPHVSADLEIATDAVPWPENSRAKRAGVSAFGFSGTNAHVILEEAPAGRRETTSTGSGNAHLLTISGKSEPALRSLAEAYTGFLSGAEAPLADICFTANTRRTHHDHRLSVVGASSAELGDCLHAFLAGETRPGLTHSSGLDANPEVVFVFPGQGPQWPGMGSELLHAERPFRESLERTARRMEPILGWSVLEAVADGCRGLNLEDVGTVQPLLFAIQVALAEQLRSWGIEPAAVVGFSVGEVAAAHIAGGLSLADAAKIVCRRSALLKRVSQKGGMAVIELPEPEVQALLASHEHQAVVAGLTSSSTTIVSGDAGAIEELVAACHERDVFSRLIDVNVASHSPHVDSITDDLLEALDGLGPQPAAIPIYSTVTGCKRMDACDGAYWVQNVRAPVLFHDAVTGLVNDGNHVFVELSPHPVLLHAIQKTLHELNAEQGVALATSRRDGPERATLLGTVGALHVRGQTVDLTSLEPAGAGCVDLPNYPWQHDQSYWLQAGKVQPARAGVGAANQADADKLLYELRWTLSDPEPTDRQDRGGTWLVLADRCGVGEALASRVDEAQDRCLVVHAGDTYERESAGSYSIDPSRRDHVRRLLTDISASDPGLVNVVHLWSLNAERSGEASAAAVGGAARDACASIGVMASELARLPSPPRLWTITSGAQPVDSAAPAVVQAPTWAFGRALAEELRPVWGGLIDLDPDAAPGDSASRLVEAISQPSVETELVLRGGGTYVPRLQRRHVRNADGAQSFRLNPAATYLITGAFGGLGLSLARWLADRGARWLVLAGRSVFPPRPEWDKLDGPQREQADILQGLATQGVNLRTESLDVADEPATEALFSRLSTDGWPPIRGLIHAAGVVSPQPIEAIDSAGLAEAFRAKVEGSWVLHRCLKNDPLDFFVLFSSASALLGSPFLAAYGAANGFMDALAHYRRSLGLAALSVNWGFWEAGMATRHPGGETGGPRSRGMNSFAIGDGLGTLERLLTAEINQAVVLDVDWSEWARFHSQAASTPLLSSLVETSPSEQSTQEQTILSRSALLSADPRARPKLLESYLSRQAARVLMLPVADMDPETPLMEYGIDSLMALELKNRLQADVGVEFSAVRILEGASVTTLSQELSAGFSPDTLPAPPVVSAPSAHTTTSAEVEVIGATRPASLEALVQGLDEMSEGEVDRWLKTLLEESRQS